MIVASTLDWNIPTIKDVTMVCILEDKVETLVIYDNWTNTFNVLNENGATLTVTTWCGN